MNGKNQPPDEGLAQYIGNIGERLEQGWCQRALRVSVTSLALAGIGLAGVHVSSSTASGEVASVDPGCDENLAAQQLGLTVAEPLQEPMRPKLKGALEQVPTLEELGGQFPEFADYQQRLAHINMLDQEASVSVCDFQNFIIDKSRITSFSDQPNYHIRMRPNLFVFHITATRYPNGVDGFVQHLKSRGLRVAYFIDESNTYSLFEDDTHMPAHAQGLNSFSQGVEIEASNIYEVTPSHIRQATMTFVEYCLKNNLAPSEYTGIGHYAGDVLYDNPSFNPRTGKLSFVDKSDMPQELVQVIVNKAQALHAKIAE